VRLYDLTEYGHSLARSTRSPNTPAWIIIHFLDKRAAMDEQISEFTGIDRGTTMATLRHLKNMRPPAVREVGREEMVGI
jgi:hypothetical protein